MQTSSFRSTIITSLIVLFFSLPSLPPSLPVKPTISVTASENFLDEGDSVTLHCEATGYPLPTITWLWNNKALNHTNTDDRRTIESQPAEKVYEVRSKLTIANLVPDDSGEYRCRLDGTFLDGQLLTAEQNINVQGTGDGNPIKTSWKYSANLTI